MFGRKDTVTYGSGADVIGNPDDESGSGLFWRRTLVVPVTVASGTSCHIASVHVRPGAVVGKKKLEFLARLNSWIAAGPRPLVLGVDTNSAGFYEDGAEFWDIEADIWGAAATHGLRDTWNQLDHGFSATHRFKSGRGARFDQIWASAEIHVGCADHHLALAKSDGSDHALVTADIHPELPPSN